MPLGIKSTKPEQLATLNKLEAENQQLTQELRHTLDASGDHQKNFNVSKKKKKKKSVNPTPTVASLALVREALHEIYMDRLQSQGISLPN